jgi:hypothetical protein
MLDSWRRTKPKILVLNNENPAWPKVDLVWAKAMLATLLAGLRQQDYTFESYYFFTTCRAWTATTPAGGWFGIGAKSWPAGRAARPT